MSLPVDPNLAAAYLLVSLTLTLTPGPDTLFVIAAGMRHRVRGAVVSALGIGAGCVVHCLVAALGLSALLLSWPLTFDVVKSVGAAYLAWLGVKALRSALSAKPSPRLVEASSRTALPSVFRQALVTNLLNPKIPLFFMAILPQFVDASRGRVGLQMFLLGFLGNAIGVLYLIGIGSLSGSARTLLARGTFGRWLDGVAGVFFIGLALRLAVTGRPQR